MTIAKPPLPTMKTFADLAVWLLCGAVIGLVLGLMIVPEEVRGRAIVIATFTLTGALWGGAAGARIIRATGWMTISGAILGAVLAILINGNGKAAVYGAPFGVVAGIACGLAIERRARQYTDTTEK